MADKLPAVRRGFFGCVASSSFSEPSEAARVPYTQGSQAVVDMAEFADSPGNAAAIVTLLWLSVAGIVDTDTKSAHV